MCEDSLFIEVIIAVIGTLLAALLGVVLVNTSWKELKASLGGACTIMTTLILVLWVVSIVGWFIHVANNH